MWSSPPMLYCIFLILSLFHASLQKKLKLSICCGLFSFISIINDSSREDLLAILKNKIEYLFPSIKEKIATKPKKRVKKTKKVCD